MNPDEPIAVAMMTKDGEKAARLAQKHNERKTSDAFAWEAVLATEDGRWEVAAFWTEPSDD